MTKVKIDIGFRKYEDIKYLEESDIDLKLPDNEVYEKIDGSNCQVRFINGRIRVGNRSKFIDQRPWNTIFWFPDFTRWANSKSGFYNLPENLTVYGEWTTDPNKSIQQITYPRKFRNRFFLIDVFDENEEKFVSYDEAKEKVRELGVKDIIFLDRLYKGYLHKDILNKLLEMPSKYREEGKPLEGIVIKNYKNQTFAKKLGKLFSEIREEGLSNAERYVTQSRIIKIMNMLREAGIKPTEDTIANMVKQNVFDEHDTLLANSDVLKQVRKYSLR